MIIAWFRLFWPLVHSRILSRRRFGKIYTLRAARFTYLGADELTYLLIEDENNFWTPNSYIVIRQECLEEQHSQYSKGL